MSAIALTAEVVADTAEVAKLCDRWGRWLRSGEFSAGGGGFKYEPPDPADVADFSPGIHDPSSEIMDRLIARLGKPMRKAIVARHYWECSDRDAAIYLHTNKTLQNIQCGFAYRWLDGHITGITGKPVCEEDGLEGINPLLQVAT